MCPSRASFVVSHEYQAMILIRFWPYFLLCNHAVSLLRLPGCALEFGHMHGEDGWFTVQLWPDPHPGQALPCKEGKDLPSTTVNVHERHSYPDAVQLHCNEVPYDTSPVTC